jgi:hypothetical protein
MQSRHIVTPEERARAHETRRKKSPLVNGSRSYAVKLPVELAEQIDKIAAARARPGKRPSAAGVIRDFLNTRGCRARVDELCAVIEHEIITQQVNKVLLRNAKEKGLD